MPKKGFNKKSATTYQLLYREQADPRIHEEGASELVFHEVGSLKQPRAGRTRAELEDELFGTSECLDDGAPSAGEDSTNGSPYHIRPNEGEAAEHGVYYDDTEYDYMQHLRDLGGSSGVGQAIWIDASEVGTNKGKKKMDLDQALREMDLEDSHHPDGQQLSVAGTESSQHSTTSKYTSSSSEIVDPSLLPSSQLRHITYQNQQDIPDALAGFQPDMDLRLREVLEALDDDAYIDADVQNDSFFGSIAEDREEVTLTEFTRLGRDLEDEDDGWETDDTAKPAKEYGTSQSSQPTHSDLNEISHTIPSENEAQLGDGEFMANFRNLPKAARAANGGAKAAGASLLTASSALTAGGRHKKRRGAKTSSDTFSMTSSSLARTDALTTLDARFEKTLESYLEDDGEAADDLSSIISGQVSNASELSRVSKVSGLSKASKTSSRASGLGNDSQFDDIMDDFLSSYSHTGKRRVVRGKPQTGIEQLDEIRRELGPPRITTKAGP